MIDEDKLRCGDNFIKKAAELPWMFSKDVYENANNDGFARYQKDKDSLELLSMQTFLSNINRGYIKNKKDAWEGFKTVKSKVESEALKDIVERLDFSLFGPDEVKKVDDIDDGGDGGDGDGKDDKYDREWDGYENSFGESIGERD